MNATPDLDIANLSLKNDTGASSSDGITADPTVVGSLTWATPSETVHVQFDHDGDGQVDGTVAVEHDGDFEYVPEGLSVGHVTLKARAAKETADAYLVYGGVGRFWTSISRPTSLPRPPSSACFTTRAAVTTDAITADPTLVGAVSNDTGVAGLVVEIDLNGDGSADASVLTDNEGSFLFVPEPLAYGGTTVAARVREWDPGLGTDLVSDWVSVSFTFVPGTPASIAPFTLRNDTGYSSTDGVTSDPTVTGTVSDADTVANVTIEFDVNNDDVIDGTAMAEADGTFIYTPTGLAFSSVTIRARTRERDFAVGTDIHGDWTSVTYTFQADSDLYVSELSLLYEPTVGPATDPDSHGNGRHLRRRHLFPRRGIRS